MSYSTFNEQKWNVHGMITLLNSEMMFSVQTPACGVRTAAGAQHNPSHSRDQSEIDDG